MKKITIWSRCKSLIISQRTIQRLALAVAVTVITSVETQAAAVSWVYVAGPHTWETGGNWSPTGVSPTGADAASILGVNGTLLTLSLSSPGVAQSLTIDAYELDITGIGNLAVTNQVLIGGTTGTGRIAIAGTSTLSAATVLVSGGNLLLDGRLTAPTVTIAGGTISGRGTLSGNLVVGTGALTTSTLAAGNLVAGNTPILVADIGTLTTSNLTLRSDASTILKVAGATHPLVRVAGTDYDRYAVTGTATLGGNLQIQAAAGSIQSGDQFTFIQTGTGIAPGNNSFATVTYMNNALGFTQLVVGNNFQITATQTSFIPFARTPNEAAVAAGLNGVFQSQGTNSLINALNSISGNNLPEAFDQLSPQKLQIYSSIAFDSATFATQRINTHLSNLRDGLIGFDGSQIAVVDGSLAPSLAQIKGRLLAWNPANTSGLLSDVVTPVLGGVDMKDNKQLMEEITAKEANRWSTFVSGNVIMAEANHTTDLAHQDYTSGGATLGADYRIDKRWVAGGFLSYAHTDATLDHIGSEATVDSITPGIYVGFVDSGWYANGIFSYGFNSYDSDRKVNFGGLNGTNSGSSDGGQFNVAMNGGYEFTAKGWKFGPTLGLQYVNLSIDSFSESGPTALDVKKQDAESLRSLIGLQARRAFQMCNLTVTPRVSAAWQHEILDNSRGIGSQFSGISGGGFTVETNNPERDSALLSAGLDVDITKTVTLFADYIAQVGQEHYMAQSIQAGVKVGF